MIEQEHETSVIERYNPEMVGTGLGIFISGLFKLSQLEWDTVIQMSVSSGVVLGVLYTDIKRYLINHSQNSERNDETIPLEEIDDLNQRRRFMRPPDQGSDL